MSAVLRRWVEDHKIRQKKTLNSVVDEFLSILRYRFFPRYSTSDFISKLIYGKSTTGKLATNGEHTDVWDKRQRMNN